MADPATLPDAPAEPPPHLLLVDDDQRLRRILKRYLERNGFTVTEAADAADARAQLALFAFDLAVLDVMMPGESGLQLLTTIRVDSGLPVLMLTAAAEAGDRIAGLERGANDYLAKPFEPRELVLRLRNILSRAPALVPPARQLALGQCVFDLGRTELLCDGKPVHLTEGERALLLELAATPGEPVTRAALAAHTPGTENERAVDVQMTRLRRKIEKDPRRPRYLQTIRGMGYVLKPD